MKTARSLRLVSWMGIASLTLILGILVAASDRPLEVETVQDQPMLITLAQQSVIQDDEVTTLKLGARMPEFELTDFRGKTWNSDQFAKKKAVAVIFMGIECPLVRLYSSRLSEIQKKYSDDGVQLVGINSNLQDSMVELSAFARDTGISFPLLKDPRNRVADSFGAQRTPEVFVFDQDKKLVYRGQIDDQYTYGRQRPEVGKQYVVDALEGVLQGTEIETQLTDPIGCIIGRSTNVKSDATSDVTYSEHISRILQDKCVSCHRPGEIAPFSLLDYDEVSGWADMIQEVVNENRMPPWHANPAHGEFKNDIRLSSEEKKLINQWVDGGVAQGDPALLPKPRTFVEGWQIGQPDVVIPMSKEPYQVPATGVVEYQYFVVPTNFKEDRWINAAEIRIGNRAVVHHVIVALHEGGRSAHGAIDSEWITACAPGSPPLQLPDGFAKLIPAGAKLLFQMHYTPNGTPQEDVSSVGFKFVDADQVKKAVGTREVINTKFEIPAGEGNHEVVARTRLRSDTLVLALFPHMHLRGKSFRYIARYPDKSTEILLDVPNYDFNWQNSYIFKEPKRLPRGTTIQCIAHFDNSKKNIANPNPRKSVRWGDQTFEEMMIGYFDMALADQDLTADKK